MSKELKESEAGTLWKFSRVFFKYIHDMREEFSPDIIDNGWDMLDSPDDVNKAAVSKRQFSFNTTVMYLGETAKTYNNTDISKFYKVMAVTNNGIARVGWMHTTHASWLVPYE